MAVFKSIGPHTVHFDSLVFLKAKIQRHTMFSVNE